MSEFTQLAKQIDDAITAELNSQKAQAFKRIQSNTQGALTDEITAQILDPEVASPTRKVLLADPKFQAQMKAYLEQLPKNLSSDAYEKLIRQKEAPYDNSDFRNYLNKDNIDTYQDLRSIDAKILEGSKSSTLGKEGNTYRPVISLLQSEYPEVDANKNLIGQPFRTTVIMDADKEALLLNQVYGFTKSPAIISQAIELLGQNYLQPRMSQIFEKDQKEQAVTRANFIIQGLVSELREHQKAELKGFDTVEKAFNHYRKSIDIIHKARRLNATGKIIKRDNDALSIDPKYSHYGQYNLQSPDELHPKHPKANESPQDFHARMKVIKENLDKTANVKLGDCLSDMIRHIEGKIGNDPARIINMDYLTRPVSEIQQLGNIDLEATGNKWNYSQYVGPKASFKQTERMIRLNGYMGGETLQKAKELGTDSLLADLKIERDALDKFKKSKISFPQRVAGVFSSIGNGVSHVYNDIKKDAKTYTEAATLDLSDEDKQTERYLIELYRKLNVEETAEFEAGGFLNGIGKGIAGTSTALKHFGEDHPLSTLLMVAGSAVGAAAIIAPHALAAGQAFYMHGLLKPAAALGKTAAQLTSSGHGMMAASSAASVNMKAGFVIQDIINGKFDGHVGHALKSLAENPGQKLPAVSVALGIAIINAYIGADYLSKFKLFADEIAGNKFLTGALITTKLEMLVIETLTPLVKLTADIVFSSVALAKIALYNPIKFAAKTLINLVTFNLKAQQRDWANFKAQTGAVFKQAIAKPLSSLAIFGIRCASAASQLLKMAAKVVVYSVPTALFVLAELVARPIDSILEGPPRVRKLDTRGVWSFIKTVVPYLGYQSKRLVPRIPEKYTVTRAIFLTIQKPFRFVSSTLRDLSILSETATSAFKQWAPFGESKWGTSFDSVCNEACSRLAQFRQSTNYAPKSSDLSTPKANGMSAKVIDGEGPIVDKQGNTDLNKRATRLTQANDQIQYTGNSERHAAQMHGINHTPVDLVDLKEKVESKLKEMTGMEDIDYKLTIQKSSSGGQKLEVTLGDQIQAKVDQFGTVKAEQTLIGDKLTPLTDEQLKLCSMLAPPDGTIIEGGNPEDIIKLVKLLKKDHPESYTILISKALEDSLSKAQKDELKAIAPGILKDDTLLQSEHAKTTAQVIPNTNSDQAPPDLNNESNQSFALSGKKTRTLG